MTIRFVNEGSDHPAGFHRLTLWPFGVSGEPNDCTDAFHLTSFGEAVWRCCECGIRLCAGCFEVKAGTGVVVPFLLDSKPAELLRNLEAARQEG